MHKRGQDAPSDAPPPPSRVERQPAVIRQDHYRAKPTRPVGRKHREHRHAILPDQSRRAPANGTLPDSANDSVSYVNQQCGNGPAVLAVHHQIKNME
jgi:hypothetical protein